MAACTTLLTEGMTIDTRTPELEEHRRSLLTLLAWRYPAEAVHRFPDAEFHRWIREYALEGELRGRPDPTLEDRSHPYIAVDMARCIDCYRCVRICDELQGQSVWHIRDRGRGLRIEPDGTESSRQFVCRLRRLRGYLSDWRPRRCAGQATRVAIDVDPDDVSVLWGRLRDECRHA